jgi:hypothetical protein
MLERIKDVKKKGNKRNKPVALDIRTDVVSKVTKAKAAPGYIGLRDP